MEIKIIEENSLSINNRIFTAPRQKSIRACIEENDYLTIIWNVNFPPEDELKFRKLFAKIYPKEFAGFTIVHIVIDKETKEFYIIENIYELKLEEIDIIAIPTTEYKRTCIYGAFKLLNIKETPVMFELVNIVIPWEHVYFASELVPRIISTLVEAELTGSLREKLKETIELLSEKVKSENYKYLKPLLNVLQSFNI